MELSGRGTEQVAGRWPVHAGAPPVHTGSDCPFVVL